MTAWTHHDPAVRRLIRQAQADAWDEGYGDDDSCRDPRLNPYREETP